MEKLLWTVFLAIALAFLLGVLTPNVILAQTPADIIAIKRQAEIIQRQEQERLQSDQEAVRRRSERINGIDTDTLQPKIEVPPIGAPCREINTITINGAPKLSIVVRSRIMKEFSGHCLNVGDIERILAEITKDYIDRGYITTRAYLPQQDLSTGHLEILVIEGVVGKISIEDGNANSISIGNVFPGVVGDRLNLRDLEQGIDQINRLGSNNARLDIEPGESVGTSQVVVHNQPTAPYHFSVSLDNQGSESTGQTQAGVTLGIDSPLNFNEFISFTHREATPGDRGHEFSRSDSGNFNIPFGYSTLSLGTSYSQYDSTIHLPSGLEIVASGSTRTSYARLDRVVYRDQSSRASLSATLTSNDTRNYLENELLEVSSRKLTTLALDGNLSTGFAGGVMSFSLGYTQGLEILGALEDQNNLPDWAPRAQFGKYTAGLNFQRPFRFMNRNASFSSQLRGQKANDTLYGSEQIFIGGIYTVRGFHNNSLSGDHGYYWRNELSLHQPFTIARQTISTRFYAGYDYGWVKNRTANIPEGSLSGAVIGLSANCRGASFDIFSTRSLSMPASMTRESTQTWFRMAYSL